MWKEVTFFLCQKLEGHGFLKILFRLELWTTICQNSHLYSRGTFWEVAGKCGCKLGSISLKWSLIFSVNLAVDYVCIVWFISRKCLIFRTKNHGPLRLPLNCEAKCRHRCLLLMLTCGNCSLNIEVAWRWSRNLISGSSQIIFFLMHEKSSEHMNVSNFSIFLQSTWSLPVWIEGSGGGGYSFQYLFKNVLSFLHKRRGNGMFSIKTTEIIA